MTAPDDSTGNPTMLIHDIADYAGLAEQTGCHIFITDEA